MNEEERKTELRLASHFCVKIQLIKFSFFYMFPINFKRTGSFIFTKT